MIAFGDSSVVRDTSHGGNSPLLQRYEGHLPSTRAQEEDPVAQFVIIPNFEEDEAMLRETREDPGRSPPVEKRVHVVLSMEVQSVRVLV